MVNPFDPNAPLLVALHGGTYTHEYFNVAGSSAGSFFEIASKNGFPVLAMDRPGYGLSGLLPEAENTFPRQAELLDRAIDQLAPELGDAEVVVVGHSIGGMVGLEIAARQPHWNLAGVCATGMGARVPAGGSADQLAALNLTGVVDLPIPEREKLWYGPTDGYSKDAVQAARRSFAPAPMVELVYAPTWADRRLDHIATRIRVPIHHAMAEFDALWDASDDARQLFLSKFDAATKVESRIVRGVGHCIDHHILGSVLHLQQLAFAREAAYVAASDRAAPAI